jgi:hypothetical protein
MESYEMTSSFNAVACSATELAVTVTVTVTAVKLWLSCSIQRIIVSVSCRVWEEARLPWSVCASTSTKDPFKSTVHANYGKFSIFAEKWGHSFTKYFTSFWNNMEWWLHVCVTTQN